MRLLTTLLFIVSVVVVPQFAIANQATTIDELAALTDIEQCAECHEDIHDEWKESWHGKSLIDSRVIRVFRTFIIHGLDKDGLPRSSLKDMCLPCHAPQAKYATPEVSAKIADLILVAADDPDQSKKDDAIKELSKINVNCIICHNMMAVPDRKAQPGIVYGPKSLDKIDNSGHEDSGIKTEQSMYLSEAKFCAECHHGCPPGMPSERCPTQWTAYNEHYLKHGGKETCQGCHMKMTEDEYKSHEFPGTEDVEFAKTGIDLKLHAFPTEHLDHLNNKVMPAVILTAQVTNKAGHGIPHG
jgi:hypothetical protein